MRPRGRVEESDPNPTHREVCSYVRKLIAAALVSLAVLIPALALAADAATTDAVSGTTQGDAARANAKRKAEALRAIVRHKERKRARARARRRAAHAASTASPALQAIAACESGGNPRAIGGGGAFRGKYQFDQGTWASVGGSGDPAAAPEAEQDRRAAVLYARSGASPWPVCGQ